MVGFKWRSVVIGASGVVALFVSSLVSAGQFAVYAPALYVRESGAPQAVPSQFNVANPGSAYTLQLYNGGLENDTYEFVSSTVVKLNGVTVISPGEINQTTKFIEKPVTLQSTNTLSVEVRGKPGGAIVVGVSGIDNDVPQITAQPSPEANAAGWNTTPVTVSFQCTDNQSAVASCTAPISFSNDGAGQVANGTAVDLAGNRATASATVNIDQTPPTISVASTPTASTSGWNRSDVTVSFLCADTGSGVATCASPTFIRAEGANQTANGRVADVAGLSATTSTSINLDKTPPTITAQATTAPSANGWYNHDVHITYNCTDALSGIAYCEASKDVATEGLSQPITGRVDDNAGNTATTTMSLNVDKTPPSITANTTPTANAGGWYRGSVSVRFTCEDALSGIDRCPADINVDGNNTTYIFERTAWDLAGNTAATTLTLNVDTSAPTIAVSAPTNNSSTTKQTVSVTGTVADDNGVVRVTVNGVTAALVGNTFTADIALSEGINTIAVTAEDVAGNTATQAVTTTLLTVPNDNVAPVVAVTYPIERSTISGSVVARAEASDNVAVTRVALSLNGQDMVSSSAAVAAFDLDTSTLANGVHTLTATTTDAANNQATQTVEFTVSNIALPSDPATIAPSLDPTTVTTVFDAMSFIYSGTQPIQTGMSPSTIDANRIAALHGYVRDDQGQPLSGVVITVHGHTEYGQTVTRADGRFDMVVNGGGQLTLTYKKPGFLSAQRIVTPAWNDYASLPDVMLIQYDAHVSAINLSIGTLQVAQGGRVSDEDGERQPVLMFPRGTTATIVRPDGSRFTVPQLKVRTTEYTVGANGAERMPAPLPPLSAYTYAVELSVDEAVAVGSQEVRFNQAVAVYVENFLGFPVGEAVPVGYYNAKQAAWLAEESGLIIGIVGTDTTGRAVVDVKGMGQPATDEEYLALGLSDDERSELARRYTVGTSLWRVTTRHFSPFDFNWSWLCDIGITCDTPKLPPPEAEKKPKEPERECNSIIECQQQVLGESVAVTGTDMSLDYRSDRVPGRVAGYSLDIPVAESLPAGVKAINVEVTVAGRTFRQSMPLTSNQTHRFNWDGKDAYGRTMFGLQSAKVKVGYSFPGRYVSTRRFNTRPTTPVYLVPVIRQGEESPFANETKTPIGPWDARSMGLGGWTLSEHHAYDTQSKTLYQGDGTTLRLGEISPTINSNTDFELRAPTAVDVGPDGSIYVVDAGSGYVRRYDASLKYKELFGPSFRNVLGIAIGPDKSIYISEADRHRVMVLRPNATDWVVFAGVTDANASYASQGDGGPATEALFWAPAGLDVGPDGSVYIADAQFGRVRRVTPEGVIATVAGGGAGGDGSLATEAQVGARDVAVTSDGTLYITDSGRIRRVSTHGVISTIAGIPNLAYWPEGSPDGSIATQVGIGNPTALDVAPDGRVFFVEPVYSMVMMVDADGKLYRISGGLGQGFAGDGGIARDAQLNQPRGVALAPDDTIFVGDNRNRKVRRIAPPTSGSTLTDIFVPSEDGDELFHFNQRGRHVRTLNALTGAVLRQFTYDNHGYVNEMRDAFGQVTRVSRYADGTPYTIVAPRGQITSLALDPQGFLSRIANPANDAHSFGYTGGGLMTSMVDPRGGRHTKRYDEQGRLVYDENSAGGAFMLAYSPAGNRRHEVLLSSSLGREKRYFTENLSDGTEKHRTTAADGTVSEVSAKSTESRTVLSADGTSTVATNKADPRFAMMAPSQGVTTTRLPSGVTSTETRTRSVTLGVPGDLLSLTTLTDTLNLNGRIFTRSYDAASRTFSNISAEGRAQRDVINAPGQIVAQQYANLAESRYGYDTLGRLTSLDQGMGVELRHTTLDYDFSGYVRSITDTLGQATLFDRDLVGRVTRTTLPDGRVIDYTYDEHGNVTSITPPGRPRHAFAYTPIDQEEDYTPPNVGIGNTVTHYTYNLDKELELITRPDGERVDFVYNSKGQLESTITPTRTWRYAYHGTTGQVTSVTDGSGSTLGYTYDGSLLKSQSWSGAITGTVAYGYDNNFRLISESVNGSAINFSYDRDSLITQAGAMTVTRDTTNGLLTGTTLGNTITTLGYNSFGELANDATAISGSSAYTVSYTRDNLGRITEKRETIQGQLIVYGYSYDTVGRLTTVKQNGSVVAHYDYDSNSNRLSHNGVTADYDDQDRLLRYGTTTYSYTANGERMAKAEATPTGAAITQYQYDVLGNLIQATLPDGTQIDYLIDGQQRRVGKKVNGVITQAFLYRDQLEPIAELDGNGNLVSRFIYASKSHAPDYMIKAGTTYRIVTDHLGSPRLIINTITGDIAQRLDYDEFGNVDNDTNPGFQPFGFAGGVYDQHTKLTRFGARDYDASIGRWTAKDPIRFGGGDANLYGYVSDDPINWFDSFGLAAEHETNKTESNRNKHEEGQARKERDRGGEKGDKNRSPPRVRPENWKGPWPPRIPGLPILICPLCPYVVDLPPPSC